jgi:hypothetical protein
MRVPVVRAYVAVSVGLVLLAGCADSHLKPARDEPGWTQVADPPLSPRYGAHAFWLDERVVVMGGTDTRPCPPSADCVPPDQPPFRDGAALDLTTGRWRPIADAPVPLGWASSAIVGDTVYLWITGSEWSPGAPPSFVAYDAGDDRWQELPLPQGEEDEWQALAAAGDLVVAYQGSQENGVRPDLAFDPSTRTWAELPRDPLIPSFDRTMVWTDDGLVLIGIEDVPQTGSRDPAFYRAAVLDLDARRWRRLPDSEIVGYDPTWFWSAGRVVNPTLGASDGGDVDAWGRSYSHGGMLDPASGTWSSLPDPPRPGRYPGVSIGGGDYVVSLMGAVLHVPSGTWFELLPPPQTADEGQAITWARDRLFVWGGVRWDGEDATVVSDAWFWFP